MSKYCIITCHGFTGYPEEMEPLGKHLQQSGLNWLNLTLPGHDATPTDLKYTSWEEWKNYIQIIVKNQLTKYPDGVFFSGLSLGGVMTLYAFQEFPDLKGGITLSAPVRILNWWQSILIKLPIGYWVK
ncbi:MAG: alpha/beta hydrolase, partial [Candidatus Kariarchaeaceae archaeon]